MKVWAATKEREREYAIGIKTGGEILWTARWPLICHRPALENSGPDPTPNCSAACLGGWVDGFDGGDCNIYVHRTGVPASHDQLFCVLSIEWESARYCRPKSEQISMQTASDQFSDQVFELIKINYTKIQNDMRAMQSMLKILSRTTFPHSFYKDS